MTKSNIIKRSSHRVAKGLLFALTIAFFLILLSSLMNCIPLIIGYYSLHLIENEQYEDSRKTANISLRNSARYGPAKLAVNASFTKPLLSAAVKQDIGALFSISKEWIGFTEGQSAAPYLWLARAYTQEGQREQALACCIRASAMHNLYPEEQEIGYLQIIRTSTNIAPELSKEKVISLFLEAPRGIYQEELTRYITEATKGLLNSENITKITKKNKGYADKCSEPNYNRIYAELSE
jgi:hypothetical protein